MKEQLLSTPVAVRPLASPSIQIKGKVWSYSGHRKKQISLVEEGGSLPVGYLKQSKANPTYFRNCRSAFATLSNMLILTNVSNYHDKPHLATFIDSAFAKSNQFGCAMV
ncbi:hypothetical protein V6N13_088508 [Hibiscus sabdariffa]|uniref:Uncharacterized protein n=1 Tax=Hibiscus sabdariffa TaxID=183260 RepID=A0ABR2FZK8_9ROSI